MTSWSAASYKKDAHNCYSFVLTFLVALGFGELSRVASNRYEDSKQFNHIKSNVGCFSGRFFANDLFALEQLLPENISVFIGKFVITVIIFIYR